MISDIGPGMEMLIEILEKAEGDYADRLELPNGYVASIIRTAKTEYPLPEHMWEKSGGRKTMLVGGSYGAEFGLFEMMLFTQSEEIVRGPDGFMTPKDCARKLRIWFELPPA